MRLNSACRVMTAAAFCLPLVAKSAWGGDGTTTSVVGTPATLALDGTPVNGSGQYSLLKHGKIIVKPGKPGDGTLLSMKLVISKISCTGDDPGKCGTVQTNKEALMDISVRQYITAALSGSLDMMHVGAVKLKIVKGKAIFDVTGTNKAVAGDILPPLVVLALSAYLPQTLAIHAPVFRDIGSGGFDLEGNCAAPIIDPTCLDGSEWAVGGMVIQ